MKEVKFLVPTMAELDKMSPEEMQQKMIETLLGDSASVVPPSDHLGLNVDVSI